MRSDLGKRQDLRDVCATVGRHGCGGRTRRLRTAGYPRRSAYMSDESKPPTTALPYEPLWNIDQAAAYLGVCDDTARPLLEKVAVHLSQRTVRYFPEDVHRTAAELRGKGPRPSVTATPAISPDDEPIAATRRPLARRVPQGDGHAS
jgi:hypothetical protein